MHLTQEKFDGIACESMFRDDFQLQHLLQPFVKIVGLPSSVWKACGPCLALTQAKHLVSVSGGRTIDSVK